MDSSKELQDCKTVTFFNRSCYEPYGTRIFKLGKVHIYDVSSRQVLYTSMTKFLKTNLQTFVLGLQYLAIFCFQCSVAATTWILHDEVLLQPKIITCILKMLQLWTTESRGKGENINGVTLKLWTLIVLDRNPRQSRLQQIWNFLSAPIGRFSSKCTGLRLMNIRIWDLQEKAHPIFHELNKQQLLYERKKIKTIQ